MFGKLSRLLLAYALLGSAFTFSTAAVLSKSDGSQENKSLLRDGQKLFKSEHCQNCHSNGTTGGCLGPILAGERARRTRDFVESRISNEPAQISKFNHQYGFAELMTHPRVSAASAKKLVTYIFSLPAPKSELKVSGHSASNRLSVVPDKTTGSIEIGKRLVYEKGCLACHSIGGVGGQLAPAFDGIGHRRDRSAILAQITGAELLIGKCGDEYNERGVVMPPTQLKAEEISHIVSFLSSL